MSNQQPLNNEAKGKLKVWEAILIGHLVVSSMVLIFILGFSFIGFIFFKRFVIVFLLGGFTIAWLWWSLMTPKWRNWAHKQGVDPDKLQNWAVLTGLVWPKGWIFEKTEFRMNDKEKK